MAGKARGRNAHDNLVRYTFSRPQAVAIIVRRVVGPEFSRFIDFDSLRPRPTVHTDTALRTRAADLQFQVDLMDPAGHGERLPLWLTLEHLSKHGPRWPCRALAYVGDMWAEYIREHPKQRTVPAIVPILLVQRPARKTPRRLSQTLALTPRLRGLLGPTVELTMYVDDLSGSVLDDPLAPPGPRALVEITRALLHAYRNPGAHTRERLATLGPQFDILLDQGEPLGSDDVYALWRYVIDGFGANSPLVEMIVGSVGRRAREMYVTVADQLRAEGRKAGLSEGRKAGLSEGRKAGLSEGRKAGLLEGRAAGHSEGRAAAVLEVLEHRAVPITASARERVLATRDEPLLRHWLARALTVASADALFEGG